MKKSKIAGSIVAVLALASTSPAYAEDNERSQHEKTTDQGQREVRAGDEDSAGHVGAGERAEHGTRTSATAQQSPPAQKRSGLAHLTQAQVEALQHRLQQSGHYQGEVDGIAGPMTQSALQQFQEGREIAGRGQLDEATMSALGLSFERQPVSGTEDGEPQRGTVSDASMASPGERVSPASAADEQAHDLSSLSPEQVQRLQSQLQAERLYLGKIDGVVGKETCSALRRFFQRQSQLAAQGKVSGPALSAFGLSPSEIEPVRGTDQPEREPQTSPFERQAP
jgi:peptidoglycan hydrolase-like protein with peptidoglycan-binding domain